MDQRTLLGRLLSPAGFGLVLLLFFLPFVTVSCGGSEGHVDATFTGVDLVTGADPDLDSDIFGTIDEGTTQQVLSFFAEDIGVQPLALLSALVALLAMAAGLIRERLARHAIGAGLAVLSAALITATMLTGPDQFDRAIQARLHELGDTIPATSLHPRYGFWLVLVVLAVLAAGHLGALARAWRHAGAGPPDQTGPVAPDQTGPDGVLGGDPHPGRAATA
ncbi:MAG TPA: hypothetical protein VF163_00330 [Micromonosporaceae bacterium]